MTGLVKAASKTDVTTVVLNKEASHPVKRNASRLPLGTG
jgi:hypothetical protein